MPQRIQLKRTRGWRKPADAITVARPTAWGNPFLCPFSVGDGSDWRAEVTAEFRQWLIDPQQFVDEDERELEPEKRIWMLDNLWQLRGKDLCCWCPMDAACHADVLLELGNARNILYGARIELRFEANSVIDQATLTEAPYGSGEHETVVDLIEDWIEDKDIGLFEVVNTDYDAFELLKIVPIIQEIQP